MITKNNKRICVRLTNESFFILHRLGYIDGRRGNTQGDHGSLSGLINSLICRSFSGSNIEIDHIKRLVGDNNKQIALLNQKNAELSLKVERLKQSKKEIEAEH